MYYARWGSLTKVEKRQLVLKEVRKMEEQARMVNAVGMKKQKSWKGARQNFFFILE